MSQPRRPTGHYASKNAGMDHPRGHLTGDHHTDHAIRGTVVDQSTSAYQGVVDEQQSQVPPLPEH